MNYGQQEPTTATESNIKLLIFCIMLFQKAPKIRCISPNTDVLNNTGVGVWNSEPYWAMEDLHWLAWTRHNKAKGEICYLYLGK